MKIVQINSVVNRGSTGRIAEDLGKIIIDRGDDSYIAFGKKSNPSNSKLIKIGIPGSFLLHLIFTRLLDLHGLGSYMATRKFIRILREISPDVIHLHNIHGYYFNYRVFFKYIIKKQIPLVWTFHDCWPFTGHCTFFDRVNCMKWESECHSCPNLRGYPKSLLVDNTRFNYRLKRKLFTKLSDLTIVTPSDWLKNHVTKSFFKDREVITINNGIDLDCFNLISYHNVNEKYRISSKKIVLGVANVWDKRKGLDDFIELRKILPHSILFFLVGLTKSQIDSLPEGIVGITRTDRISDLVELYNAADVFLNPTYVDNFPTTNLEALACGTPVVTYNTGGSPEAIDKNTGIVVEKGNISKLAEATNFVLSNVKKYNSKVCRNRAEQLFNYKDKLAEYYSVYQSFR